MNEATLPANQPDAVMERAEPKPRLRFEFSPAGIGKLIGALAKARKAFKPVLKTSSNPFFKSKYADLAEVIDATKDGLSDNGLAIVQPPCYRREDGTAEIYTFLAHESGEWIKSVLEMPVGKPDAQGVGSAITYGRRYSYSGMVSVASEPDDDGEGAMARPVKEVDEAEFASRTVEQTCIAPFQQKAVEDAMKASGKTEEDLRTYLQLVGYKRLEHVLKTDFNELLKWAHGRKPKQAKPADGVITQAQVQRLAVIQGLVGMSDTTLKAFLKATYGIESRKLIPSKDYDAVMEYIDPEGVHAKV